VQYIARVIVIVIASVRSQYLKLFVYPQCHQYSEMDNKRRLNVLNMSHKVRLILLVERGNRKKYENDNNFNNSPNILSSHVKQKDNTLMFNFENMKIIKKTPYSVIDKC
jgi:hypothetical protein